MAEALSSLGIRHSTTKAAAASPILKVRASVLVCLVLIAGSFAAAAAIQMRLDRVHALAQAQYYERLRARDIADVAEGALGEYARAGRDFAEHGAADVPSGVQNIATFDPSGVWLRVLRGTAENFPDLPNGWMARASGAPLLFGPILAFRTNDRVVAVQFDAARLVPPALLERAALVDAGGRVLASGRDFDERSGPMARAAGWPLWVRTTADDDAALAAWRGAIPLYLFVILGPAVTGACLAVFLVGEFERRSRSARTRHVLCSARSGEHKWLVRLADAERRAVEAVRSKAEFIAHMSHELRTPLNAVIGFAEVIEKGLYGPAGHAKYVEYAHDIAHAGRALHSRIGDILEYANVEAARFPLSSTPIELAPLARTCADEQMGRAFSRRITLDVFATDTVVALADSYAVKRAISLLLDNALTYARDGGRVRIDVRSDGVVASIVVRDAGTGFSQPELHHAAEPFVRFDRRNKSGGMGLGLSIATALVHRMGGALIIGGLQGVGAAVELRLPLAQ